MSVFHRKDRARAEGGGSIAPALGGGVGAIRNLGHHVYLGRASQ